MQIRRAGDTWFYEFTTTNTAGADVTATAVKFCMRAEGSQTDTLTFDEGDTGNVTIASGLVTVEVDSTNSALLPPDKYAVNFNWTYSGGTASMPSTLYERVREGC